MVCALRRFVTRMNLATLSLGLFAVHHPSCRAFVVQPSLRFRSTSSLFETTTTASPSSSLPEIQSMRIAELKKELESYGISTKSFLEKKELVQAVEKARADGLQPKQSTATSSSSSSTSTSRTSSSSSASSSSSESQQSREERLQEELTKCSQMTTAELKQELKERGIRTNTFFEKSEFVQALAKARVDGVSTKGTAASDEEEVVEVKNVEVLTDDAAGPRAKAKSQDQQQRSNPFGGGAAGNPFGGGAGVGGIEDLLKNMGGMGGMGGIADMLKNMGAGAGGSPFGGGAGNPFGGDVMGKAQQLMQNPKVRELVARAQSNPALMTKVQECMSNPMAMTKYANDPDVKELIDELKKCM